MTAIELQSFFVYNHNFLKKTSIPPVFAWINTLKERIIKDYFNKVDCRLWGYF